MRARCRRCSLRAPQARQRALEGVQEGAAQHGLREAGRKASRMKRRAAGAAAQAHEQHRPGAVEGPLDGLVEAQRQRRCPRGSPVAAAAAGCPDRTLSPRRWLGEPCGLSAPQGRHRRPWCLCRCRRRRRQETALGGRERGRRATRGIVEL